MSMVKNSGFDERQILVRGKGFQLGFFISLAVIILNFAFESFFSEEGFIEINVYSRAMLCIWIPTATVSIYFILNEAYEKINETGGRVLMIFFIIVGLIEIAVSVSRMILDGIHIAENGVIGDGLGQIVCGLATLGIAAVYFIKQARDKKSLADEGE